MKVYLVTDGGGSDGNEWSVSGIFSTKEKAREWIDANPPRLVKYRIEEWEVDPQTDEKPSQVTPTMSIARGSVFLGAKITRPRLG